MFTNIKEKFLNLSKSVYFLSTESDSSEPVNSEINLYAGSEILTHFRNKWFELRQISEENAKNAEKLATVINEIQTKMSTDHQNITKIVDLLVSRPTIHESVQHCILKLQNLEDSFYVVEKSLNDLEDLIDRTHLQKKKLEHLHQLELYKEKKLENLEIKRNDFANKHAKKVIETEQIRNKLLAERQKIFQEAFDKDLEIARTQGIQYKKSPEPSALLEEIQLDLNQDELDAFLEDSSKPSS